MSRSEAASQVARSANEMPNSGVASSSTWPLRSSATTLRLETALRPLVGGIAVQHQHGEALHRLLRRSDLPGLFAAGTQQRQAVAHEQGAAAGQPGLTVRDAIGNQQAVDLQAATEEVGVDECKRAWQLLQPAFKGQGLSRLIVRAQAITLRIDAQGDHLAEERPG